MRFVKMQGLGNDYIYVDCMKESVRTPQELARRISDRHFGVGADGLILIGPSEQADYSMDIYNADGSRAEMCGNGIRCVGKYLYDNGYLTAPSVLIETMAGLKNLELIMEDGVCTGAKVDMGEPEFSPKQIPVLWNDDTMIDQEISVGGKPYNITCLSMGNPHAVIFVPDVERLNLEAMGPLFENHRLFPARVNTEFVTVLDRGTVRMRVWERGAGETMACGTGASATAVAAVINRLCDRDVVVKLNGGDLQITWNEQTNRVSMAGPAVTVCTGEF